MMSRRAQLLATVAVGCLLFTLILPLWEIDLVAPQYPEGLSLQIWPNRVTGNLESVNLLNHYIGMKPITPAAIPELAVIPKVLVALVGIGALALGIRRKWALALWLGTFASTAAVGLVDFYRWEFQYGHDLSPDAPIKIAGMSYQPPLIGWKMLLNITSYSYPHWGGVAVGVSLLLGAVALFSNRIPRRKSQIVERAAQVVAALLSSFALFGCHPSPQPISLNLDQCERCHMVISDPRFGGEVISRTGKIHKYDSIDCLLESYRGAKDDGGQVWVVDFANSGSLVEASRAHYFRSRGIRGAMGSAVLASANPREIEKLQKTVPGEVVEWDAISNPLRTAGN